jgi:2-oxoisovalerate ferredoxin oxidoreductase alpha subunit
MKEDITLQFAVTPVELVNRMGGNLIDQKSITDKIHEMAGDN